MGRCPSHRNWGIIPLLYHKWGIATATETGELSLHCIINEASPKPQKLGNYPFTVPLISHRPSHRNCGIIPSLYHKWGIAQATETGELSPYCIINEASPKPQKLGIILSLYHKWGIAKATETGELSIHCIINEALPKQQKLGNYSFTLS